MSSLEALTKDGSPRCQALTKSGTQCTRKAEAGSLYCWQHQEYKSSATITSTPITSTSIISTPTRSFPPFSLQNILKFFSEYKLLPTEESTVLIQTTYDEEQDILSYPPMCPNLENLPQIPDGNYLYNIMHNQIFDYNSIEGVLCATQRFLESKDLVETSIKVHSWITELKTLGIGRNGYVFSADITKRSNIFAVKVNMTPQNTHEYVHELFSGLFGTNQLRAIVPNFAFVFAGFQCGPVITEKTKAKPKVEDFCSPDSSVQYILYEFIQGKSFWDWLPIGGPMDFLNYILQLCYSLQIAYEKIGFTHYDLNPGNVIVRPIKAGYHNYIKYDSDVFIRSNYIATIIDYAYARFEYKGSIYAMNDLGPNGITNQAYPIEDLYKIIMFSLWLTSQKFGKNQIIYDTAVKIYHFFDPGNPKETITKRYNPDQNIIFDLPPEKDWLKIQPKDLANYIRQNFDLTDILFTQVPKEGTIMKLD